MNACQLSFKLLRIVAYYVNFYYLIIKSSHVSPIGRILRMTCGKHG